MDKSIREKFTDWITDLQDYISILSISNTEEDIRRLESSRVQSDSIFDHVKISYVVCRDYVPQEAEKPVD